MAYRKRLICGGALLMLNAHAVEVAIPYHRFTLENGLTLLVHEDRKAPIVAVNIWYHVGAKDEQPGRTGFAHLFEHLMFNGSEHFDDDYFKVLERVGATGINGTTDADRTNYFQEVPREALDTVLWMESDRMGHLLGAVTQARLDEQRGVVLNEKRQGDNQPYRIAWRLITENSWPPGHPYSWEVIGSESDIAAATLNDVQAWFRRHYGAANAVIVIAGDIAATEAYARVRHFFGSIPAGPPRVRHQTFVARRGGMQRMQVQDRVPHARLYKVWNIPPYGTTDGNLLSLVADVLADGKSSRLYQRLVRETQRATEVNAFAWLREIAGQFVITATAAPGVALAQLEATIDEELARMLAEGPQPEELQRCRTRREADFTRGCERVGGLGGKSDILARDFVLTGDAAYHQTLLRELREVAPEQVARTARAWLDDTPFVLHLNPFPDYQTTTALVDRAQVPIPKITADAHFPPIERAALANGLQVVLATRRETPLVICTLSVDAGIASDALASSGVASLLADLLDEGTERHAGPVFARAVADLGARITTGCSLDATTMTLNTLTRHLDPALALFAEMILQPALAESDVARLKKQRLAAIAREQSDPQGVAMRLLPERLYGTGHPYGVPLSGTGDAVAVAGVTRADLLRAYHAWFKPNHATLVVAGDVAMTELLPRLERLFGGWRSGAIPQKPCGRKTLGPQPRCYLVDRPAASQSLIVAASLVPPRNNSREAGIEALNTLLGGSFTSRVNLNLREAKHWSYGVRTRLVETRGMRLFLCVAPVQADRTLNAMRELQQEFEAVIGARPPTEEELRKVVTYHTLQRAGRWETLGAVAGAMEQMTRFDLPDDYHETYAGRMRALTPEAVKAAAMEVVRPREMVWLVVGDRAALETPLRGMGWGEVTFLDTHGGTVE